MYAPVAKRPLSTNFARSAAQVCFRPERTLYALTTLGGPEASTAKFIVGWHIRAAHEISSGIALALVVEMPQLLPQFLAAFVLDA